MSLETDYSEVIERFSGFANFYDRFRPDPPDDWCDLLIQLAPVERLEQVVDLGCGTGRSTRCWADRATHVIGVDPSADMLHEAQAQTRSPNVDHRLGFGHQTGLPDQRADIVTCCESLHWMEPVPTFDEIARLLRPGGIFAWLHYSSEPVITLWEADRAYINFLRRSEALDDALHVTSAVLRWTRAEYVQCMEVDFHYVRQLQLHHVVWGDAARLSSAFDWMGIDPGARAEFAQAGRQRSGDGAGRAQSGGPAHSGRHAEALVLERRCQNRRCGPIGCRISRPPA